MKSISELKHVHFIGIGGISMSSLALYLRKKGIKVTGTDRYFGEKIPLLTENGCDIRIDEAPVLFFPDLVVYSGAIKNDDEELSLFRRADVPCIERQVFLGEVSREFRYVAAIAGTHGKTTVTAILSNIFLTAEKKFYAHIGGDVKTFGNSLYSGDDYFITEACEYRRSLLSLRPNIGVVLNAENDHPDTYKNLAEIYDAFDIFLDMSNARGLSLVCGDTLYYKLRRSHYNDETFGIRSENRFSATEISEYKNGFYRCLISDFGIPLCEVKLPICGEHNIYNALAAAATAALFKIDPDDIKRGIETFPGVKRRFEKVSIFLGAEVYSDYAHHPSEIRAAIKTARKIKKEGRKIFVVFQPHTYSRTQQLYGDFLNSFDGCDEIILLKEYPARETPDMGKTAFDLFRDLRGNKHYYENIVDVAAHLMKKVSPADIVLILGAGDVVNLCKLLS